MFFIRNLKPFSKTEKVISIKTFNWYYLFFFYLMSFKQPIVGRKTIPYFSSYLCLVLWFSILRDLFFQFRHNWYRILQSEKTTNVHSNVMININFYCKASSVLNFKLLFYFPFKTLFLFSNRFTQVFSGEANLRSQKPKAFCHRMINRKKNRKIAIFSSFSYEKKSDRKENASWH